MKYRFYPQITEKIDLGEFLRGVGFPVWILLIFIYLGSSVAVNAQIAPVTNPVGGFEIDGNLMSNSPTNGVGDWINGPSGSGGGFLFLNDGTPLSRVRTFRAIDPYRPTEDNVFTGGGKFNDNPADSWRWKFTPSSGVQGKSEINNAYVHFAETVDRDQWIIVVYTMIY